MKTILSSALALMAAAAAATVQAADDVKLQLQWVTQAQFAGYYVALDKGFYAAEDLNVTILPGGPDIAPPQVLAGGGADAMLNWMPSALAAREKGRRAIFDTLSTRKPCFSRCAPSPAQPQGRQHITHKGTKKRPKKV